MRPSAHTEKNPSRISPTHPIGDETRTPSSARRPARRRALGRLPLLVLIPVLLGIFGGPVSPVGADDLSDAQARQKALAAKLKDQKADIAKINALQADLTNDIAAT